MAKEIEGIIAAIVTPFDKDNNINFSGFRKLINYLIDNKIHGILPAGSQGEFYVLSQKERFKLMETAVEEANGRIFVMPNTGSISTKETIELTKFAEKAGADCASIITPFFISPSQDELFYHYSAVCDSTDLPVFAYNNPGRTGGTLLKPETVAKLAQNFPHFKGIKDSSGDITQVSEIIRMTPPDFKVFMGRDTVIFGALMYGAAGAIAASANVAPKLTVDIYNAYKNGEYDKAKMYQQELAPLRMAFDLGSFPVVVKEALDMMGLPAGNCRMPIMPLSQTNRNKLREILMDMSLI
jgi:4-hydroxy-tetrahydrodipicolinate synthase